MAHQQHGHATAGVDAYGNPVAVQGGPAVAVAPPATGAGGQFQPVAAEEQRSRGILHRSGSSSSSSSSEDDGMGGRRKKGIKDKIKEKLPGGRKGNQQQAPATAGGAYGQQVPAGTTGTYGQQGHAGTYGQPQTGVTGTYGQPHAGVTDTYGQHGHTGVTGTYGQPHAGATGPVGAHGANATTGHGEKKGLMDKIKDKLPGHH